MSDEFLDQLNRARERSMKPYDTEPAPGNDTAAALREYIDACDWLRIIQDDLRNAKNQADVRHHVDKARQALQVIVSNAEVIW